MALTLTATPVEHSSANDALVYTLLESVKAFDPVTYPNYRYIFDVWIDDVLVARIKRVPDPITGVGVCDVGPVARNYLNVRFNPAFGDVVAQKMDNPDFFVTVTMRLGEEYGGNMFLDLVIDSDRPSYNSYNGRGGMLHPSLRRVTDAVATNRPGIGQVLLSSQYYLIPYFPTTTDSLSLTVTPTGGGTPYSVTFAPDLALQMQVVNVSPGNLNALQPGTITVNTRYYTVNFNGYVYKIDVICEPTYEPMMFHFLNQYGGFDSKLFSKANKPSYDFTRQSFAQLPYVVGSDGTVSTNSSSVFYDGRRVYANSYTEKSFFSTDLLTDAEYTWLKDLLLSPMVYLEDRELGLFPVMITDSNYSPKKVAIDDLTNLTINIQYATSNLNTQFR